MSLASDAQMRFRRFTEDGEKMFKFTLEHGSAYLISGPARSVWQHGMNPVKTLRYSITFRTIKDKQSAADPRQAPDQIARRLADLGVNLEAISNGPILGEQLKLALG